MLARTTFSTQLPIHQEKRAICWSSLLVKPLLTSQQMLIAENHFYQEKFTFGFFIPSPYFLSFHHNSFYYLILATAHSLQRPSLIVSVHTFSHRQAPVSPQLVTLTLLPFFCLSTVLTFWNTAARSARQHTTTKCTIEVFSVYSLLRNNGIDCLGFQVLA